VAIRRLMRVTAAMATLACAGTLQAHHSNSMFDLSKSLWLKGTVVRYQHMNPHALITLEERTPQGRIQQWIVEGPRLRRIELLGVDENFIKVGEVIDVCGFFLRDEALGRRLSPDPNSAAIHFIHGQVLVKADGKKWLWGPYGQLDRCVAPAEWDTIIRGENPLPARPAP
jgi:hypothetical protein